MIISKIAVSAGKRTTKLVAKFTYETVVLSGRVADLADFVGHVVIDLWVFYGFEATPVKKVLIFDVVLVFFRWFDRVNRIEEVGERYE